MRDCEQLALVGLAECEPAFFELAVLVIEDGEGQWVGSTVAACGNATPCLVRFEVALIGSYVKSS